jgi:hypothetical protein
MSKINATYVQRRAIEELLKETCVKAQGGTCEYVQGWSDKLVAGKVSPTLNAGHVASMRRMLGYGNLAGAPHTVSNKAEGQLKSLQEYVGRLEWRIHLLERRLDPKNNLRDGVSLDALEALQQAKQ